MGEDARDLEGRIRSVSKQIARGKEFIKRRYGSEHFSLYYQSHTNTYDSIENLKKIYQSGLDEGPFVELIVSTRPDCITEEIVELLASFKDRVEAVVVELGLESSDEGSLVRLGRNHDVASYRRSVGLLRSAGIGVYTHIMLGLPKEDSSTVVKTAHLLNEMGTDGVKIHDLHVLRSTVLEDWHESGEVTVASSDRHLASLVTFLRHLEPRIVVARLICETPRSRRIAPRFPIPKQQIIARLSALLEEGDMFKEICFDDVQAGKNYSSNRYRPDDNRGMLYRVFLFFQSDRWNIPRVGAFRRQGTALPRVCRLRIFLLSGVLPSA